MHVAYRCYESAVGDIMPALLQFCSLPCAYLFVEISQSNQNIFL